jgi:hypothetical protein
MNQTPVCSTEYMKNSLRHFSKEEAQDWFTTAKRIDEVLAPHVEASIEEINKNQNMLSETMIADFKKLLINAGIDTEYDLKNLEAFYGYTVYAYCDNKKKVNDSNNPDLYYGLAKATKYGKAHTHALSDAFNYVLEGDGVFTGDPEDEGKFDHYYHGTPLVQDMAFEIPIGMTHGHLVKENKSIWFLFVQECGFKPDLRCAGDFHLKDGYDSGQFGPYFI